MNSIRFFRQTLVLWIMILSNVCIGYATDSLNLHPKEFLRIKEKMTTECSIDSIFTREIQPSCWMPYKIKWGFVDTTLCSKSVSDSLKKDTTFIIYPDSLFISGSYFIEDMNNDSIPDIILRFTYSRNDTQNSSDTSRFLCIFGQNSLKTIDTIKVTLIDTLQNTPFLSRDLRIGNGMTDYYLIEPYDYSVFHLDPVSFNNTIKDKNLNNSLSLVNSDGVINAFNIEIFPNPVTELIRLKVKTNLQGDFQVIVYNLKGQICLTTNVTISNSSQDFLISSSSFGSGEYQLVIIRNDNIYFKRNFIVIK